MNQVPRLPRKSHRQSGGEQGTPEGRQRDARGTPERRQRDARGTSEGCERDAKGTPGRTSDSFAVHQVPRLPRKSHRQSGGNQGTPEGRQRDARGTPEGRQRDARGMPRRTSDPFAVHQVPGRQGVHPTSLHAPSPSLPRKSHRHSGRGKGRQRDARGTLGPLQCTKPRACQAKATGRAAETRDARGTPEGRQTDVRGMPRRTSDSFAVHQVPRLPPAPATQKPPPERRRPRDPEGRQRDPRGTPERTSDRPLCSAPSPAPATQKPPAERAPEGRQRDARAYIRPLCRCTKSRACHAKATGRAAETKGRQRDARGSPEGRQRDARGTPEGRQGVHVCVSKMCVSVWCVLLGCVMYV